MSARRIVWWNVALVAVEGGLVLWAHAVGVSWLALGLLFFGLALAASAGLAYFFRVHLPRAHRRYERRLRMALAEHALLVHAATVQCLAPPALPTAPEREAA